jgi:hypothetical protein
MDSLNVDSLNDALIACVNALGGSKVVGPMLWPEKMADAAQRALLDCLNPERPAHLTPEQMALVLRKARQAGHHEALGWLLDHLGYAAPVPMAPVDEAAELQRQFIAATEHMAGMMARLQALQAEIAVPAGLAKLRAAA